MPIPIFALIAQGLSKNNEASQASAAGAAAGADAVKNRIFQARASRTEAANSVAPNRGDAMARQNAIFNNIAQKYGRKQGMNWGVIAGGIQNGF